jgi:hypothetical protein
MKRVGHHLELTRSERDRLRCVDAELTRRDEKAIALLKKIEDDLEEAHVRTMEAISAELVRYYRAKPGTKYDITARKGKR